jgi:hypothetical protein
MIFMAVRLCLSDYVTNPFLDQDKDKVYASQYSRTGATRRVGDFKRVAVCICG